MVCQRQPRADYYCSFYPILSSSFGKDDAGRQTLHGKTFDERSLCKGSVTTASARSMRCSALAREAFRQIGVSPDLSSARAGVDLSPRGVKRQVGTQQHADPSVPNVSERSINARASSQLSSPPSTALYCDASTTRGVKTKKRGRRTGGAGSDEHIDRYQGKNHLL